MHNLDNSVWSLRNSEEEGREGIVAESRNALCVKQVALMAGRGGTEVGEGISESLANCLLQLHVLLPTLEMQILPCPYTHTHMLVCIHTTALPESLLQTS